MLKCQSGEKLPANVVGTTLISSGERLELQAISAANPQQKSLTFSNYSWKIDGSTTSRKSELRTRLSRSGEHKLELSFQDQYGRFYFYKGTVRVMEPQAYEDMMAAVGAAVRLLLMPDDEAIYLPIVIR